MKILALNLYYAPDIASSGQLLTELCEGLQDLGNTVSVVAGQPSYISGSEPAPAHEVRNGVDVHRVSMGKHLGRNSMLTRLIGYTKFMFRARKLAKQVAEEFEPDVILTLSNPPTVGLIAGGIAKSRKVPYLYVLYDIFPDVVRFSGGIRLVWPLPAMWDLMNRWIFKQSHTIVVPGERMEKHLQLTKDVPVSKTVSIPNWGTPDLSTTGGESNFRESMGIPDDEFLLLYSGNLGVMHPVEDMVEAASIVAERPIRFLFIGEGKSKAYAQKLAAEKGLINVQFEPFVPIETFSDAVHAADAVLVGLKPGTETLAVPSRTYTFMSAGKPILAIMPPDSDIAQTISSSNSGINSTNVTEFADAIVRLQESKDLCDELGRNALTEYRRHFTKTQVVSRYHDLLMKISDSS
jgi:glycosyltransferase involved in cell wall biosynthesis